MPNISVSCPVNNSSHDALHAHGTIRLFTDATNIPDLHPHASMTMKMVLQEGGAAAMCDEEPAQCFLYPDGSYKDGCASWGLVIVARRTGVAAIHRQSDGFSFVGFTGGVLDDDLVSHLGLDAPSSRSAEQYAAAVAASWVSSAPWLHTKYVILPDYMETVDALNLRKHGGVSHCLSDILAARIAEASFAKSCCAQHTHGHVGQPWNEMADCIAKTASHVYYPCSRRHLLRHTRATLLPGDFHFCLTLQMKQSSSTRR